MFLTDKHALFFAHKRLPKIMSRVFLPPSIDLLVNQHAGLDYYTDVVLARRHAEVDQKAKLMRLGPGFRNSVMRDIEAQARHAQVYLHGKRNVDERINMVQNQHFYLSARWKRKMDMVRALKLTEQELFVELNIMWAQQKIPAPVFLPGRHSVNTLEFEPWCAWQTRHNGAASHLLRAYRRKKWERLSA